MQLTIKLLNNQTFKIDVGETTTIAEIKQIIFNTNNKYDIVAQKIIHQGKILKDDDTVSGSGIIDCDFVVMMCSNKKAKNQSQKTSTVGLNDVSSVTTKATPVTTVAAATATATS